jgi:Ca-activated chloride channel homolog
MFRTWSQPGWFRVLLLFQAIPALLPAQQAGPSCTRSIRTSVDLVLVPVTVTDRRGAAINGLGPEQFTVFEDKVRQRIVSFGAEDGRCSIGIVLDLSGSMRNNLALAKEVVQRLVTQAGGGDEMFLLTVSSRPETVSDFTVCPDALSAKVRPASAEGWTALTDTVFLGLERIQAARTPRKAIVVVSDGMDNHSRYAAADLLRSAMEADTQIYTVGLTDIAAFQKPIEVAEQRNGVVFLRDLASQTGGLYFGVTGRADAGSAAENIGLAIRNRYVIGYYPGRQGPRGKWRKIQVKLDVPGAAVTARSGYYAP